MKETSSSRATGISALLSAERSNIYRLHYVVIHLCMLRLPWVVDTAFCRRHTPDGLLDQNAQEICLNTGAAFIRTRHYITCNSCMFVGSKNTKRHPVCPPHIFLPIQLHCSCPINLLLISFLTSSSLFICPLSRSAGGLACHALNNFIDIWIGCGSR